MDISEVGLEAVNTKITSVRLQFYAGKWYVEYRRVPKFYIDQWWWFDDSAFKEYKDAVYRAQVLAAQGYVTEVRKNRPKYFDVTQQDSL